jgi:Protein of unknown function (DUF4232)
VAELRTSRLVPRQSRERRFRTVRSPARVCGVILTGVIPWIPAVPPAPLVPPVAPACHAAQLAAHLELQGATGSAAGGILFRNIGSQPCSLLGTVRVRLLDGSDPAGVELTGSATPHRPSPGVPAPSMRSIRHGEHAFVQIWWSNWCGEPRPTRMQARLPSGDGIVLSPIPLVPRCDNRGARSTLLVGRPEPWIAGAAPSTRLPLTAAIVEHKAYGAKVIPLVRGRQNQIAVYHVALNNTSRRPFRFGARCPTYVETLGFDRKTEEPIASELHVLNCRPAGALAPGAHVVFEMRIRVPHRLHLGTQPLTWTLAPATYLPPFAGGVLHVAAARP